MNLEPLTGKAKTAYGLCTQRQCVFEGSVRSGKTVVSLLAWLRYVIHGPDGNLLMVGRTERTLERNIIHVLIDMLGPDRCRLNRGSGELWMLGRRIYIAGANDERAHTKIQGQTLAGAYVDEIATIPESFYSQLLSRLSVDGAQLFGTSNPDTPRHWLLDQYLSRAAVTLEQDGSVTYHEGDTLDLARLRFVLPDNPHLPAGYVDAISREFVGLWYRRFILGEWVVADGAIYDMFDQEAHVVDDGPTTVYDWWLGVDYGASNPFVALLFAAGPGKDGVDRVWVMREWRHDPKAHKGKAASLTNADYSQRLANWIQGGADGAAKPGTIAVSWAHVDPSAAAFIIQLHNDRWVRPTLADNAVLDGIQSVSTLIGQDRLRVHRSCTGLLDELAGYVWDPDAQEKGEDKPDKRDDHSVDAARYGVMGSRRLWGRWLVMPSATAAAA